MFRSAVSTKLHRWCIPTSDAYAKTCDQMRKGMLADHDNSSGVVRPPPRPSPDVTSKDSITVLLVDNFGR